MWVHAGFENIVPLYYKHTFDETKMIMLIYIIELQLNIYHPTYNLNMLEYNLIGIDILPWDNSRS